MDREKVIKALEYCTHSDDCIGCIHWQKVAKGEKCTVRDDALALLKEQEEEIENLKQTAQSMMEGICLLKEPEAVEPTINEDGEAYCICSENVGIIPRSKNLPSIRSKYCSECGRRMKWKYD